MSGATLATDPGVRHAFARDASGMELVPESVARPKDVDEVAQVLTQASAERRTVTPAGGQTSTTGASISDRGMILSLRALDRVLELDPVAGFVRVEAGAFVGDVKRACAAAGRLLPLDPTSEDECTVGGAVACNATGARSLRYGDTRRHVRALEVVLIDGSRHSFRRPQYEKNAVGYHFVRDPVDWFVGSEGTLGVVTAVEFGLLPLPVRVTGLAVPFVDERAALAFVAAAREHPALRPRCLEYFDGTALGIVRAHPGGAAWTGGAMVYLEDAGDGPFAAEPWLALAERKGADTGAIQVFEGEAAIRDARRLRHSIPATMNERSAAARRTGGRKVSTDWAVPYRELGAVLDFTRRTADQMGVEHPVVFGHAGNGHPHQNWIAADPAHLERAEAVVEATLREVLRRGGTVAAEHGIGKIKSRWASLQLSPLQVRAMRALKRELDPLGLLAPGNILP
ncbi:MAG TPA: FAD-binding oxidoreductase [Anaeromyxobacteraceae bacterium]|nr:FAD-binding oxidoreductase [Anaeromyxobacteraceae bacterium]